MKNSFLVLLMLAAMSVVAQKKKKTDAPPVQTNQTQVQPAKSTQAATTKDTVPANAINPLLQHYAMKYQLAVQWNDYDIAKDALYDLIVENQGNDSTVFDLAGYYYQNRKYPSAVLVAQTLLKRNPKNAGALEIAAIGYENLGVYDRSLQSYESLYLLQNNPNVLYKMAALQLQLKRYREAVASSDILLAAKDLDALKIGYPMPDNKTKDFSMKVAVLNLKGVAAMEQSDKATAKTFFEQALAIAPDFPPAKENLAKVK
ncbi:MAG: tetratricopeptide repeat protein [Bacteroidetes bacterium]|nr:tetratricopeptide repeat protein [Bacteroidota bacterium]MBS1541491.1 tetratricopeptide repeat protein [Bacteroidota bacterium]